MRLIFDIESNAISLESVTRVWCICTLDLDSRELLKFGPNRLFDAVRVLATADKLIGHNIDDYDLPVLSQVLGFDFTGETVDTLLLSKLVFNGLSEEADWHGKHSLKAWGKRLGCYKGDQDDFSKFRPQMLEYCAQDCRVTAALLDHIVQAKPNACAVKLEQDYARLLRDVEKRGFRFDTDLATKLGARLDRRLSQIQAKLDRHFPPKEIVGKLPSYWTLESKNGDLGDIPRFDTRRELDSWRIEHDIKPSQINYIKGPPKVTLRPFNANSSKDIADALTVLGWEPTEVTATGNPKTKADILWHCGIRQGRLIASYAKHAKLRGYVSAWMRYQQDGILRPHFKSIGSATGRSSASDPNLQNIPSFSKPQRIRSFKKYGTLCRGLFQPREGFALVGCDLAGIEVRILGHRLYPYDGGKFASEVVSGFDIHTRNAEFIGIAREQAKTVLYASMYGAGPARLSRDLGINRDEAKRVIDSFTNGIDGFSDMKRDLLAELTATKRIKLIDGRRIQCGSDHKALNYAIQGDGAILLKHWALECGRQLVDTSYQLLLVVHDELQCECLFDDVEEVKAELEHAATKCGEQLGFRIRVDANAIHGDSWAETH